eukprot:COSAG01_NODE_8656_length_2706_cov_11.170694_3_plen_54_part_00
MVNIWLCLFIAARCVVLVADPYLTGTYGVAYTRGLQEGEDPRYLQAVVTLKHW